MSSCKYCGAQCFGPSCPFSTERSPSGQTIHVHWDSDGCIYCGAMTRGNGCPFSPTRQHQRGVGGGSVPRPQKQALSAPIPKPEAPNLMQFLQKRADAEEAMRAARELNDINRETARRREAFESEQNQLQMAQAAAAAKQARETEKQTQMAATEMADRRNEREKIKDTQEAVFRLSQIETRILALIMSLEAIHEEEAPAKDMEEIASFMKELTSIESRYLPDIQYKTMLAGLRKRAEESQTKKLKHYIGRWEKSSIVKSLFKLKGQEDSVLKTVEKLTEPNELVAKGGIAKVVGYVKKLSSIDPESLPDAECINILSNLKLKFKERYTSSARCAIVRALLEERYSTLKRLTNAEVVKVRESVDVIDDLNNRMKEAVSS